MNKTVRLDDRVDAYRSFMDYPWVQALDKLMPGTSLEAPIFALIVTWKATANAFAMPFLMMQMLRGLEQGYLRSQPSAWEQAVRTLAQTLPMKMKQHGWSNMKQKQLSEMVTTALDGAQAVKPLMEPLDPQQLFHTFLFGPGGSELQLGVIGLCETCFLRLYHAYEHFMAACIGVAKRNPDYKASNARELERDTRAEFGDEVAEYCWAAVPMQVARNVRNALEHNGGKVNTKLEKPIADLLRNHFFIEDGKVLVVAENVRSLFNVLKLRVQKVVEKALTIPQFGSGQPRPLS